jgi:DNA-binding NarL/FixJ family response regulator
MAGERYLHPVAATALFGARRESESEAVQFGALSEREQDVIRLSAQGFTGREIGEQLNLSPKTVETYRQRALEKLGIESRSTFVRFAVRAGLLDGFRPDDL